MAEVWGALLRRLKIVSREKAVLLSAGDLTGVEDAIAWVFVSACKSVSQTLHTTTPTIITPLVEYYISCPQDVQEPTYHLIRRVLTALIHHVKNAAGFAPVGDFLCQKALTHNLDGDEEALRRLLEVLSVACSVRHGSRMSDKHLAALLPTLDRISITPCSFAALLKLSTAILVSTTGDMGLWMGSGRRFLEHIWSLVTNGQPLHLKFALELHGVLVDMNWGGWKMIALPVLLKRSISLLDKDALGVLRLFSKINEEGKLGEVDVVWKRGIEAWLKEHSGLGTGLTNIGLELHFALKLSPYLSPDVTSLVTNAIEQLLSMPPDSVSSQQQEQSLGLFLRYVANRPQAEWSNQVNMSSWTSRIIAQWSGSSVILTALVELKQTGLADSPLAFDLVYNSLRDCLLSHDADLRLSALRVLATCSDAPEVVQRCLVGEEVSLDVRGVRERVLRTSRVTQGAIPTELSAELCSRWLLAQLKVNLKPLWKPAANTIAEVVELGWGETVWSLVWNELQATNLARSIDSGDDETTECTEEEDWESERTWRDPSAHKLRTVIQTWQQDVTQHEPGSKTKGLCTRFSGRSYALELLNVLGQCHLDLRQYLVAYLNLFAKFSNPKALYSTDKLQVFYLDVLAHPDRSLQTAALSCLLAYKTPAFVQWQEKLRALLDETRWRDELTSLDLSEAASEITNVVIRMLYGILLERKGKSRRGNERRTTILGILGACTEEDLGVLVRLMLKPLVSVDGKHTVETDKQRIGFLTLLDDVLKNLGSKLVTYWPDLLGKTIQLTGGAQSQLGSDVQAEDVEQEEGEGTSADVGHGTKTIRTVRQLGIKRFADFFRIPVEFDFVPYLKLSFDSFISPRIPLIDAENIQSPSALLELFAVWSRSAVYALYLVQLDNRLVPKIFDCLIANNVKPVVISKIFDIVETLLSLGASDSAVLDSVVKPNIGHLLRNMSIMAERMKGVDDGLAQRQIHILSQIAHHSTSSDDAKTLFKLFAPLLRKSHKLVPEKVKADLLQIISHLIPLIPELSDPTSDDYLRLYMALSSLFQSLRTRTARLSLVAAFRSLSFVNLSLRGLADLLEDLNSYSQRRLDEPDFDRRLKGFAALNELNASLSLPHWTVIIQHSLNSIHDPEELAIRTSSASVLRLFIDLVASGQTAESESIFTRTLLVGLKNGLRSKNELVRSEILGVLAYSVQKCTQVSAVQDMRMLLGDGDEEVNFFNNIQHVQIHRRSRALRRLADQCDDHPLRSGTLSEIILPLISNYIVATTSTNHHLVNDAITATGRLSKHLAWGAYHALVQKYMRLSKMKDEAEKIYVRALVALLENFHFPMDMEISPPEVQDDDEADVEMVPSSVDSRVASAVNNRLLPDLLKFIESRDSTTEDTTRIPVAVGIIAVAKHLPLTRLLTVTSQVLRSRSQETRDLTRETMVQIAIALGPSYLHLMIQELRGALLRGPHLHILAYTTHALLTHVTSPEHASVFHTLDSCVAHVAHVAAEVIFGESGKDVQSEDFKTKMREVRGSSSKGFDSFAIMAKHITPPYLSALLVPLRSILHETASSKVLGLVDETLKRISSGLNLNQHLVSEQLLSVCHALISQNSQFLKEAPFRRKPKAKKDDAIVQVKREATGANDHYANNSFRFIVLGLDLFQTALRRNRFDFHEAGIVSRLESMLVAVGNSLYSSNAPVLVMSLKCISVLVKCPLRSWGKSLPVLVRQTLDIIKSTGSAESELAQAALKALAVVLRDGPPVDVKEKDLVFLLQLISPDLEEPARQATVFAMLRAIVSRKFVVVEIYDIMEKVSEVMVTNHSAQVQELCRGVLLQFLLDYPQGKGRLRSQMSFLATNLSYVYESGRKSVMELLGAVITKFQSNLVQEYADLLFVSLVMVVANDDSSKCVDIASQLIQSLLSRLDEDRRSAIVSHLHTWASQNERLRLSQVSLQLYGIFIDALDSGCADHMTVILQDANQALQVSAQQLEEAEGDDSMEVDLDWQSPYHSLLVVSKALKVSPNLATDPHSIQWPSVVTLLLFPHPWVRTAASRLLGVLYASGTITAPGQPDSEVALYPLSMVGMLDVARKSALQLKSPHLDEALSVQIVKNLFFLGKCFASASPVTEDGDRINEDGDDEEEEQAPDNPLPWLFSKLSYQVRSAHIARRNHRQSQKSWGHEPLAVLRWFAAMTNYLEASKVERFLVHILSPLYRILEDDTIRDAQMDELKTVSTELQDLIQSKVGVTAFSTIYNQVRQGVIGVRRERKTLRALQVATNPAAAAKRKVQKNLMKKDNRKRKNESFADRRGSVKRYRQ
ncbi:hypothetical protein BDZ89DRAFT_1061276 [Hymenopellis radicata]|nr:hypothetical protein BDZ89DRAFT_1061276 [Hymenopellis radicata]